MTIGKLGWYDDVNDELVRCVYGLDDTMWCVQLLAR